tara:strand:- start:164 stop:409 length:246 start_codon:yes stop_codon:yes gene_type:complete
MANVYLWSGVRALVDEENPLKIDGGNLEELLDNLIISYPNLKTIIQEGVSFSVDNKLVMSSTVERIKENSEVYIFQKISGG